MSSLTLSFLSIHKSYSLASTETGDTAVAQVESTAPALKQDGTRQKYIRVTGKIKRDERQVPVCWDFFIDNDFIDDLASKYRLLADATGTIEESDQKSQKLNVKGTIGNEWFALSTHMKGGETSSEVCTMEFTKGTDSIVFPLMNFEAIGNIVQHIELLR